MVGSAGCQGTRTGAPAGAGDQRARARGGGPGDPDRGVIGEQFDEQPDRVECVAAADEPRERGVHGGEHLQHQIVAGPQVGAFVAEDGGDLGFESVVRRPR